MPDKTFTQGEMEAAIDIAINAGQMLVANEIAVSDSRVLVRHITDLAATFEASSLRDSEDYITEIDNYAEHFLQREYAENSRCLTGECEHPKFDLTPVPTAKGN
jgi:hypothetical protein